MSGARRPPSLYLYLFIYELRLRLRLRASRCTFTFTFIWLTLLNININILQKIRTQRFRGMPRTRARAAQWHLASGPHAPPRTLSARQPPHAHQHSTILARQPARAPRSTPPRHSTSSSFAHNTNPWPPWPSFEPVLDRILVVSCVRRAKAPRRDSRVSAPAGLSSLHT